MAHAPTLINGAAESLVNGIPLYLHSALAILLGHVPADYLRKPVLSLSCCLYGIGAQAAAARMH